MSDSIARTPAPPYWAVIFTSLRRPDDEAGYARMSALLEELAPTQPGFLGLEGTRGADGLGITVSYWSSLEDVAAWKRNATHVGAQRHGRNRWYADYTLRVAHVERAYTLADSPAEAL